MSLPLIRLAIGRTNGTAHHGVLLNGTGPVTACATHSPDLGPIAENTAHQLCQSCTRALLIITTAPHPSGEPDTRAASGAGRSAVAHRPIPGHLLGYCGKPLDSRRAVSRRVCANCTRLGEALERFRRRAGQLALPAGEPCHGDDTLLWAPQGRGNLVTGHRHSGETGRAFCDQQLSGPNPGATNECTPCRRNRQESERVRRTYTVPKMRERARWWHQRRELEMFDDRPAALNSGDVYSLSGCAEEHHAVAVTDRSHIGYIDLLVYLPGEDRTADARIRCDRLITIQRPPFPEAGMPRP
ncbi:hypothetical protein OG607_41665 [Streptomyces sp. NBC_01537]|uniref:hypothetical protein n=1 Tax=Streptomyces sp. NBC_01537 TaxID=2903896 RepID=UPI0038681779